MFKFTTCVRETLGDLHTPIETYLKVRDLFLKVLLWKAPIIIVEKTATHLSVFVL